MESEKNKIEEHLDSLMSNKIIRIGAGKVRKFSNEAISPLYKDTVVMVMSDVPNGKAIAKCFYIDKDDSYTLNQRICCLKSEVVLPKFLYFQINRNPFYLKFDNGVSQTNLRKEDVLNCPISYPKSKEEQEKIADFMTVLDLETELWATKIQLLEKYKLAIHQSFEL